MIDEKIKELGYQIPEAPKPLAAYIPSILIDDIVYTAGQLPMVSGELKYKGKVGMDISEEEAKKAAEYAVLNCLSVIKSITGSLDRIEKIIKLTVFINSADSFINQPEVANGASELLGKIFGEDGKHVRSAVGVNVLPRNASVEVEMVAKVKI